MGRQLGDEAFRQGLEAVVFLGFGLLPRSTVGADCDDSALGRAARLAVRWSFVILRLHQLDRRLVLGTDIAALNAQTAVAINADERAGTRDLGGIVDDGPVSERFQRGFDLTEPPVDLLGHLFSLGVLLLEAIELGFQRVAGCDFLVSEIHNMSVEPAQASRVAIRKVRSDRNPLPALGAQLLGFGLELLDPETIEQRRIL